MAHVTIVSMSQLQKMELYAISCMGSPYAGMFLSYDDGVDAYEKESSDDKTGEWDEYHALIEYPVREWSIIPQSGRMWKDSNGELHTSRGNCSDFDNAELVNVVVK